MKGGRPLDISGERERGVKLVELINNALLDTQRVVNQPYPDRIIMTRDQLVDLDKMMHIQGTFGGEERLLITRYNAMEVEIK